LSRPVARFPGIYEDFRFRRFVPEFNLGGVEVEKDVLRVPALDSCVRVVGRGRGGTGGREWSSRGSARGRGVVTSELTEGVWLSWRRGLLIVVHRCFGSLGEDLG
jgi:hypothetical protein